MGFREAYGRQFSASSESSHAKKEPKLSVMQEEKSKIEAILPILYNQVC
jgi:hypothetical protein